MSDAEMDKTILNASITNAALELLPESIASMAIIPLQMRLVHRIGRSFGYEMDMSNAKDFVATLGVGLTGQYLEQFGRKLFGGLLGGLGGSLGRGVGRQAASSAMTFATTYAIGRVAQRYYAGGTHDRRGHAQADVPVDVERGEGARAELPGPDRADVDEDRHAQPRVADQVGLKSPGAQECVIACARSARSRCGTALNATIRVAVLPRTISVIPGVSRLQVQVYRRVRSGVERVGDRATDHAPRRHDQHPRFAVEILAGRGNSGRDALARTDPMIRLR